MRIVRPILSRPIPSPPILQAHRDGVYVRAQSDAAAPLHVGRATVRVTERRPSGASGASLSPTGITAITITVVTTPRITEAIAVTITAVAIPRVTETNHFVPRREATILQSEQLRGQPRDIANR